MQIEIKLDGLESVKKAMAELPKKAKYAAVKAMNNSMEWADTAVRKEMRSVFDRPTPWVFQSMRIKYANPATMFAELGFKDNGSVPSRENKGSIEESGRTMIAPHVYGGQRHFKVMEVRLMRIGILPAGYNAVPGAAAKLDGNGNMSRGQITQLLNVLGTYTESGYNKANDKTRKRLAKGGLKSSQYGQYGFVYLVKKVGSTAARSLHLQPGVYQRVTTGYGSTLKPVLIFVKRAHYRPRLDFNGIVKRTVDERFSGEFDKAFALEKSKQAPAMK